MTFANLRDNDLSWMSESATAWHRYSETLGDVNNDMRSQVTAPIVGSPWEGMAAETATDTCDDLVALLESRQVRAASVATVLTRNSETISDCQSRVRELTRAAEAERMIVDDQGGVRPGDGGDPAAAEQYQRALLGALDRANAADEAAATAINDLAPETAGEVGGNEFNDLSADLRQHNLVPPPPGRQSIEENARWWDGLSEADRLSYTYAYPERVGGMDGLPSQARHTANMTLLRTDVMQGEDPVNAKALLDKVEESQYGHPDSRILLLGYTPPVDGADAQVIAAVGDPDTADHTAVYVPGANADLESVPENHLAVAQHLRGEAAGMGQGSVSTVMWLGYDAPDMGATSPGALSAYPAQSGGIALNEFQEGLRTSHQGPPAHTTTIGYSYGATVIGYADQLGNGLATDDIVTLGSVGMADGSGGVMGTPAAYGEEITSADDLSVGSDHVWTGRNEGDWQAGTQMHGKDPTDFDFGGNRIATDGDDHYTYWNPEGESVRNQARIIAGQYDEVSGSNQIHDVPVPTPLGTFNVPTGLF